MMLTIKFRNLLLLLFFLSSYRLSAQHEADFEDWIKFGPIPKNWKIVGGVNADWEHDDFLSTIPGTGVLVNAVQAKNSKHLISGFEHGDIEVEFDYMVPKGSNSGIYLQGRYEVQIFDSWGKANPTFADAGGIYQRYDEEAKIGFEGVPPRMKAYGNILKSYLKLQGLIPMVKRLKTQSSFKSFIMEY